MPKTEGIPESLLRIQWFPNSEPWLQGHDPIWLLALEREIRCPHRPDWGNMGSCCSGFFSTIPLLRTWNLNTQGCGQIRLAKMAKAIAMGREMDGKITSLNAKRGPTWPLKGLTATAGKPAALWSSRLSDARKFNICTLIYGAIQFSVQPSAVGRGCVFSDHQERCQPTLDMTKTLGERDAQETLSLSPRRSWPWSNSRNIFAGPSCAILEKQGGGVWGGGTCCSDLRSPFKTQFGILIYSMHHWGRSIRRR